MSAIISIDDQKIEMRQDGENLLLYYQGNDPGWDDSIAELLEDKGASLLKHLKENSTGRKEVTSNA